MAGSSAALPCSLKSSVPHDSVRLVLWFKEMEEKPIYTVDARGETGAPGILPCSAIALHSDGYDFTYISSPSSKCEEVF